MPLDKSSAESAIGKNISKLRGEGYPEKQAIAISEQTHKEAMKTNGADAPNPINLQSHPLLKKTAPLVNTENFWDLK